MQRRTNEKYTSKVMTFITETSSAEVVIQWLIDSKIVSTRFDQKQGQIIEITNLGKRINEILDHMRKTDNV